MVLGLLKSRGRVVGANIRGAKGRNNEIFLQNLQLSTVTTASRRAPSLTMHWTSSETQAMRITMRFRRYQVAAARLVEMG